MKRFILVFILLAVSAGAQAQWVKVGSTSQGTAYLWYPVAYSFPFAYPGWASVLNRPLPVVGGSITHVRYSAIWLSIAATARLYCAARPHTPAAILKGIGGRLGWIILSNGLKVVPGRWYAYTQLPALTRRAVLMSCSG